MLTSYWTNFAAVGSAPGSIMPFLKEALDQINCNSAAPERRHPAWARYCAGGNATDAAAPQQPRLGKQFARLDCAAEVCAILKHRSPAPEGYTF